MTAAAGTDIEQELFSQLGDLEERVDCSYDDCEQEAVSMLQCPKDQACETMCQEHTIKTAIVARIDPEAIITFTNSCGHSPKMSECQILPLAK